MDFERWWDVAASQAVACLNLKLFAKAAFEAGYAEGLVAAKRSDEEGSP